MAHDFAKQRSPDNSARQRRQQAAATRTSESPGSHWPWFFTGLLTGLFLAFVVYLGVIRPAPPAAGAAGSELAAGEDGAEPRKRFDFYDYLPEAEVQVDVIPVDIVTAESARQQPPEVENAQYLLQAGSFLSRTEADNRRASIILLNMDARVEPGMVAGKTWYRVQVGPFDNRRDAEAARDALAENNYDSIFLRMR